MSLVLHLLFCTFCDINDIVKLNGTNSKGPVFYSFWQFWSTRQIYCHLDKNPSDFISTALSLSKNLFWERNDSLIPLLWMCCLPLRWFYLLPFVHFWLVFISVLWVAWSLRPSAWSLSTLTVPSQSIRMYGAFMTTWLSPICRSLL